MGAFNTLTAEARCPVCGRQGRFKVQFKYGDTWQHEYELLDHLKWGGNDIGSPGHRKVLVGAIGGPCPNCGKDNLAFDVVLESDQIVGLNAIVNGRSHRSVDGFEVLDR